MQAPERSGLREQGGVHLEGLPGREKGSCGRRVSPVTTAPCRVRRCSHGGPPAHVRRPGGPRGTLPGSGPAGTLEPQQGGTTQSGGDNGIHSGEGVEAQGKLPKGRGSRHRCGYTENKGARFLTVGGKRCR